MLVTTIYYVQVSNSAQQSALVIKLLSIIRNETSIAAEIPPGKEKKYVRYSAQFTSNKAQMPFTTQIICSQATEKG